MPLSITMLAWLYLGLIGDGATLKVFHVSNSTASGNNFSPEKPMGIFPINTEHEMRQTATAVTPLEGSFFQRSCALFFAHGRTPVTIKPALASWSNRANKKYSLLRNIVRVDNKGDKKQQQA